MANLADAIEQFILHKLANERADVVILKRNEIAEEIECAPSQISYVLNTRFTIDRGFIVESRRGLGGFIRIARIPVRRIVYTDYVDKNGDESLESIIGRLQEHRMLTAREATLILRFFELVGDRINFEERGIILRSLLLTLASLP